MKSGVSRRLAQRQQVVRQGGLGAGMWLSANVLVPSHQGGTSGSYSRCLDGWKLQTIRRHGMRGGEEPSQ
jgi:hypothetical protein